MSIFLEVLGQIEVRLKQMTEQIENIRWMAESGRYEMAYAHAMQLAETAERLALLGRVLPAYTGNPAAKEDVKKIMADVIPTQIGFTEQGWFSVRMPPLPPKKSHGSVDYIRGFLYPAMQEFFNDKPPVRHDDCVLIFRHVYDRERPERLNRDHDNIEVNIVADIAALYTMPDDGPSVCDHYYCSAAAAEDRTEIYVVPREDFPQWLVVEETMPDEGVELCDTAGN